MNTSPLKPLNPPLPTLQDLGQRSGDGTPPSKDMRSLEEKVLDAVMADPTILDDILDGWDDSEHEFKSVLD